MAQNYTRDQGDGSADFVAGAMAERAAPGSLITPAKPCAEFVEPGGLPAAGLLDPAFCVHNLATRITLRNGVVIAIRRPDRGPPVLIFDCNGVLVDSEAIAATVASQELTRAGFKVSPEIVSRFFAGRRPSDMVADVETATKRKLPPDFSENLAAATMRRLRAELRATPHMEYALTWLRGPKCVASSSPHPRSG